MASSTDLSALQRPVTDELVNTTKTVTKIAAQDLLFHRSSDTTAATALDERSARLLDLTQKLLNRAAPSSSSKRLRLSSVDSIEAGWQDVIDATDGLFERADGCLDEFSGLLRNNGHVSFQASNKPDSSRPVPLHSSRPIVSRKPQLDFDNAPPNRQKPPFKPLLTSKPNGRRALKQSLSIEANEEGHDQYQHPYEEEIVSYEWPKKVIQPTEPRRADPFSETRGIWVDTLDGVERMLGELKSAEIIAIDVEHHDAHSYLGLVSLLQISSRDKDWIIDTLKPWRRRLEMLNEVFTDPAIVKVLHGAQMDVVWLQRDLGLYLVGLFDTYHACKVLQFPGASLAFLLKKYVNFDAQKQHQLADWRTRPLPIELLEYARSDTHFLIYIFECMRNELLRRDTIMGSARSPISEVLQRSKETALQRFEYPISTDSITSRCNGWAALLMKSPLLLSNEQVSVVARLYNWRDDVARDEDESVNFVLPNHCLLSLSRVLPQSADEISRLLPNVPPLMSTRLNEVIRIISEAKKESANYPDGKDVLAQYPGKRHHSYKSSKPAALSTVQSPQTVNPEAENPIQLTDSALWGETLPTGTKPGPRQAPKVLQYFDIVRESVPHADLLNQPEILAIGKKPRKDALVEELDIPMPNSGEVDSSSSALSALQLRASPKSAVADAYDEVLEQSKRKSAKKRPKRIDPGTSAPDIPLVDYEAMPSVLGKRNRRERKDAAQPVASPYAKAEKATTAVKRTHESRPGKGLTYKK